MPELSIAELRAYASSGARGLLQKGFGIQPADSGYRELRDEFLDLYEKNISRSSTLFPGVPALLDEIEARGCPGNSHKQVGALHPAFAARVSIAGPCTCVVCGDTTPYSKPHPAPLIEAMSQIGTTAAHCPYIGDDERDVQAGHAAGMSVVVVRYGYLGVGRPPEDGAPTCW
jgi:phosphoglycolate phosphatase